MSQESVYKFLSMNRGKWFTSEEVRVAVGISLGSVVINLKKLRKYNDILWKRREDSNGFLHMCRR